MRQKLFVVSKVLSSFQIIGKCSDLTERPMFLERLVQSGSQGRDNHWSHTIWTLTSQLVLGEKTGGGVKGDLRPVSPMSNVLINSCMDFTSVLGGHGGRVVTLSPPTSAAGVRSLSWP